VVLVHANKAEEFNGLRFPLLFLSFCSYASFTSAFVLLATENDVGMTTKNQQLNPNEEQERASA